MDLRDGNKDVSAPRDIFDLLIRGKLRGIVFGVGFEDSPRSLVGFLFFLVTARDG